MFTAIIPARYASTRLPGKPLLDIAGKPMVVRVAERARESGAQRVVIATDDERIASASRQHGVEAVMTRADHPTGTDRLAEAAAILGLGVKAVESLLVRARHGLTRILIRQGLVEQGGPA